MPALDYIRNASRAFRKEGLPRYLVFFVTDRCNARCRHCLFGDGTVFPDVARELSLDEIERVASTMGRLFFLLPTGGEPFLREDLGEIVSVFYRRTGVRNVAIPTNGSLTARVISTVESILAACPKLTLSIDVSLDAVGDTHDELRGVPGLFSKAVATLRELQRIERRTPRFSVNIETTVTSFNDRLLDENFDYFTRELKPTAVFTLLARGKPREPASLNVDLPRYLAYAGRLEKALLGGELAGYRHFPGADLINAKRIVRHRLIARIAGERRCLLPCYAGILGAALFANGEVYPCEMHTDMPVGNVRDFGYDFRAIWNGGKAKAARERIRRERCFCTYECFLTLNILFNPRFWPAVLREWVRIKGARAKKAVGISFARRRAGAPTHREQ